MEVKGGMRMRRTNEIQRTEEEVTGLTDETVKDTAVWGIHRGRGGGRALPERSRERRAHKETTNCQNEPSAFGTNT